MRIRIAAAVVSIALCLTQSPAGLSAQGAAGATQPLVGTWQLTGLEQAMPGQALARVANPVGILIHAANGYVIEILTQAARPATLNAAEQFTTYHGSWGRFTADGKGSNVTYQISGDLDPGRTGQRVAHSFERKGSELVLTELGPDGRPIRRKTWQRIPELEGLPEYQDAVVGFWQWTSAGMYNAAGVNVRPAYRDESVIVYTPTGHMAVVYLPPPGRKPFAAATPTVEEARERKQRIDAACRQAGRDPILFSAMIPLEGSPDELLERLRGLADAGVERVMLQHLAHEDLATLELVGREVIGAV